MIIKTERLIVFTLNLSEANLILDKNYLKLHELGYKITPLTFEEDFYEALPLFIDILKCNGEDGFNTWLIKTQKDDQIIGGVGFIGRPNENGEVEIGFGISADKRNLGYCTEAGQALTNWALNQANVKKVIAKCDKSNIASINTLKKIGFSQTSEDEEYYYWESTI